MVQLVNLYTIDDILIPRKAIFCNDIFTGIAGPRFVPITQEEILKAMGDRKPTTITFVHDTLQITFPVGIMYQLKITVVYDGHSGLTAKLLYNNTIQKQLLIKQTGSANLDKLRKLTCLT